MKSTTIITLCTVAMFTACSTSKKSTETATVEAPKENQARVQKVVAPPANTQPQKTEVLYDR